MRARLDIHELHVDESRPRQIASAWLIDVMEPGWQVAYRPSWKTSRPALWESAIPSLPQPQPCNTAAHLRDATERRGKVSLRVTE
jgi:hypothetical protein